MRFFPIIVLVIFNLYIGSFLRISEINKLKLENESLKFTNDSLEIRIEKQTFFIQEHLKQCSWISKKQIKKVVNELYVTLKSPIDTTSAPE
jgi:hypothetical protein